MSVTIGQRIRELRVEKGLTQQELSTGICTPSLCEQVEQDLVRPSYQMLALFANVLDVPVSRLLLDEGAVETMEQWRTKWTYRLRAAALLAKTDQVEEAVTMLYDCIEKFQAFQMNEETGMALVELAKLRLQFRELDRAVEACQTARALLPKMHLYHAWIQRVLDRVERERTLKRMNG